MQNKNCLELINSSLIEKELITKTGSFLLISFS